MFGGKSNILDICGVVASAALMTITNQSLSPGWLVEALCGG